jgi:MFS family permease
VSAIASGVFILLIAIIVPESSGRLERGFDFVSAALLAVWLTALAILISKGAEWVWPGPASIGWSLGGATAFARWVVVSRRTPDAVIDIRLALKPAMLRINLATFLATFGMFTNHLITMQEARSPVGTGIGLQLPVSVAGLLLLPYALTMVLLTPVTGWFLNRFGARNALWLGSLVMVIGFAYRTVVHAELTAVIIGVVLCGAGAAFAFAAMPALVSQAAPSDEVASANGVNSLVRSLSGAIASSVIALALAVAPSPVSPHFLSEQGFMVITGLVSLSCVLAVVVAIVHARRSALPPG